MAWPSFPSAPPVARASRAGALVLVALGSAGCGRACNNDRPYVPYTVGDDSGRGGRGDAGAIGQGESEGDAGPVTAEPALVAPPDASVWSLDASLVLTAPEGRELALALVRDLDGDDVKDALAVTRPAASASGAVELFAFRGGQGRGAAPVLLASGPPVDRESGCVPLVRLERVGPRSAFAELGAACDKDGAERAAVVVRLSAAPSVALQVRVEDPASSPRLTLDVDGSDRDRDGIDDVALRVTLEGGAPPFEPGPRVSGRLAFLDRPAGASRDADEPEASLRAIAGQASARAGRSKDAPSVPLLVQQLRALYRAMCQEGGGPRLTKRGGGAAVTCGASKALEDAGVAEVRSFVTTGDALRAFAAAERAQVAPATRTAARAAELAQLLGQAAPIVSARTALALAPSVPLEAARGRHPEWGPLVFDGAGHVLVRGGGRVVQLDPTTGEEQPSEVAPWPSQVLSPDGQSRWLEAYLACDGLALRATFAPAGGDGDARDVVLPVAPPLGARCAGSRGEKATAVPLAWSARGLEALVAGQPLLVRPAEGSAAVLASPLEEGGPPGSPRSASGRAVALATSSGVVVRAGAKAVRVTAPALEPYGELRQCVTNDDGTRVACLRGARVVTAVFER